MKKTIFLVLVALSAFSCGQKESAVIRLSIPGTEGKDIILSKLQVNQIEVLDTLKTNAEGKVTYTVKTGKKLPGFYYLSYNRKRLASLILQGGDHVAVSVDTLGNGLQVEGSEESVLLAGIESDIFKTTVQFDSLSQALVTALELQDNAAAEKIRYDLGALYVKHKRGAITSIMKYPYAFANITLLYQQLNENLPLFAGANDFLYYKRVYDSLQTLYPNSVYVKSLKEEVDSYEQNLALQDKISQAEESAFPDIVMPDTKSEMQRLSDLKGRPFVLVFWSCTDVNQKMFNQDLKELYARYHPKGLEVFQVSADLDKTLWATIVKEQQLPWINVCDGLGTASPAINTYAVAQLPALYIFDKEGNIVAKNIFAKSGLDAALAKLAY